MIVCVCVSLKSICHQLIRRCSLLLIHLNGIYEPMVNCPLLAISYMNKKWIFDGYLMNSHFTFNGLGHLFDKHPIATDGKEIEGRVALEMKADEW